MLLYKEWIKKEIENLDVRKQALLIALTCEKLLQNYQFFQRQSNWGNSIVLERVLSLFYEFINGMKINQSEIVELEDTVEANTPDLDEIQHPLTSYGFDAGIAFLEALSYLKDRKIEHLIEVLSGAINTVDMFVQVKEKLDPSDKEIELKIENNVFMIREIKRQTLIIEELKKIQLNEEGIVRVRRLNSEMGKMLEF